VFDLHNYSFYPTEVSEINVRDSVIQSHGGQITIHTKNYSVCSQLALMHDWERRLIEQCLCNHISDPDQC
jgi:hypothetical protein